MTDREKVIECLEKSKMVIEKWVPMFEQYSTPSGIDGAIVLLKEQESVIEALKSDLNETLSVLGEQPDIVRCKDCKYCEYPNAEKEWCKKGHLHGNAKNWFCADGERR